MLLVRTFTLIKRRLLRPYLAGKNYFWHYAVWQELAKRNTIAKSKKKTPIVVWIVKHTMAAARLLLQCCLLPNSKRLYSLLTRMMLEGCSESLVQHHTLHLYGKTSSTTKKSRVNVSLPMLQKRSLFLPQRRYKTSFTNS